MTTSTTHQRALPAAGAFSAAWTPRRMLSRGEEVTSYRQGALSLTFPLPSGLESVPQTKALTLVRPAPERADELAGAQAWSARFVQAVVEVLAGDRPLTQLVRWTSPSVYADIARRRERLAERPARGPRKGRPHVATVHVCHPTESTAEIAARVATGARSRAVAARLDRSNDRWMCTAIDFG
jgi:hypothetical protein